MIAAWFAQLLDAEAACKLAVYLHGAAGDLAEADEGEVSMTAADIAAHLGDAVLELTARRRRRTRRAASRDRRPFTDTRSTRRKRHEIRARRRRSARRLAHAARRARRPAVPAISAPARRHSSAASPRASASIAEDVSAARPSRWSRNIAAAASPLVHVDLYRLRAAARSTISGWTS